MRWFNRTNTTAKISAMETAIAKLAGEVTTLRGIAEKTQSGVEAIQRTLEANHIAHATCETTQDHRWDEHNRVHLELKGDLDELQEMVKQQASELQYLRLSMDRLTRRSDG